MLSDYNRKNTVIVNSNFVNLHSTESAGAILLSQMSVAQIINCTFMNVTAVKNGGAVFIDVFGNGLPGTTLIANSSFINSTGNFGGALLQLHGNLTINNSKFDDFEKEQFFLDEKNKNLNETKFTLSYISEKNFSSEVNPSGVLANFFNQVSK